MKKILKIHIYAAFWLFTCTKGYTQTLSDALLMKKGQACILAEYNHSGFSNYWENTTKRDNATIATVLRNTYMPMAAIGLTDRLNFFVGIPYIESRSSEPNGGKAAGVQGFQDLTIASKFELLRKQLGKNELLVLTTVGFSTPVGNYTPDYMPYSIGLGAPELSYRLIVQQAWGKTVYARAAGSYLWRGYAKAEREYYYNNGSYYTPWMDVPNAITTELTLGKLLLNDQFRVEANYFTQTSLSGDDVRPYAAPQPTNKVNFGRIGVSAHYYSQKVGGLGFVMYHNRNLTGKNVAQANTTGVGITYFFNFLKN